ncbi:MAG: SCP2 sterol-binding domain-containing protein [Promethearchaeota archaeon]
MPLFGSEEWIKQYIENLNANEAYAEAGKTWGDGWPGDFTFIVRADAELDHDLFFWLDIHHGKAHGGHPLKSAEEKNSPFVFEGPYSNYIKLVKGELDPIQGLMTGKFKLKGDMGKVMRAVKAAQELVRTITLTDTQWY